MFQAFFNLIRENIFGYNPNNHAYVNYWLDSQYDNDVVGLVTFGDYLSLIITIIVMTIIFALCCLCVWKVIKLIGRLFVRL